MTIESYSYFIMGFFSLLWPLLLFFFRRHVLGGQWLLAAAMAVFGIAVILYSTLFNTFLRGEYLLVLLFMMFGSGSPMLVYVALKALTHPQGVSIKARGVFLFPVIMWVAMFISVFVGGPDMYRMWIERGSLGDAGMFFSGSWRYNTIVLVHYYFFIVVLLVETIFLEVSAFRMLARYKDILSEYFTDSRRDGTAVRLIILGLTVTNLVLIISYSVYPFNCIRPLWVTLVCTTIQSASLFFAGWHMYHLGLGAEQLHMPDNHLKALRGSRAMAQRVSEHIEQERRYLNPYLSVPMLSQDLGICEDDIIDAIHQQHGSSFADYIDGLRIEHALQLMSGLSSAMMSKPSDITMMAHRCGFNDADSFEKAFAKVTQKTVSQWYSNNKKSAVSSRI